MPPSARHVVLSGCSGGGKSTLLAELSSRGFATVEEPGRRIVRRELSLGGEALPWLDLAAFARRAMDMARRDREVLPDAQGWIFFDRGLVDAAAALAFATGDRSALETLRDDAPYNRAVFLTPPWRELFAADSERRHDWKGAVAEYERLGSAYETLGYECVVLPKTAVSERADFILASLG